MPYNKGKKDRREGEKRTGSEALLVGASATPERRETAFPRRSVGTRVSPIRQIKKREERSVLR